MDNDDFPLKQRPFMQQDLVAGKTVAKIGWKTKKTKRMVLTPVEAQMLDEYGDVLHTFPSTQEEEQDGHDLRRPDDDRARRARLLPARVGHRRR